MYHSRFFVAGIMFGFAFFFARSISKKVRHKTLRKVFLFLILSLTILLELEKYERKIDKDNAILQCNLVRSRTPPGAGSLRGKFLLSWLFIHSTSFFFISLQNTNFSITYFYIYRSGRFFFVFRASLRVLVFCMTLKIIVPLWFMLLPTFDTCRRFYVYKYIFERSHEWRKRKIKSIDFPLRNFSLSRIAFGGNLTWQLSGALKILPGEGFHRPSIEGGRAHQAHLNAEIPLDQIRKHVSICLVFNFCFITQTKRRKKYINLTFVIQIQKWRS